MIARLYQRVFRRYTGKDWDAWLGATGRCVHCGADTFADEVGCPDCTRKACDGGV